MKKTSILTTIMECLLYPISVYLIKRMTLLLSTFNIITRFMCYQANRKKLYNGNGIEEMTTGEKSTKQA